MAINSCLDNMNLVVDDNYINDVKTYIISAATDANDKLELLIKTVNRASSEGCVDGKTAEMLKLYSERVSQLSGLILKYGKECVSLADQFYEKIDKIDENLY